MKLVINRVDASSSTVQATLTHRDQSINWSYSTFKRGKNKKDVEEFDLFQEINAFWEPRPEMPAERLDAIFEQYVLIKETLGSPDDHRAKNRKLAQQVAKLLEMHPLDEIDYWIRFKTSIEIPATFKENFENSHTNPGTIERTYLREDYRWLLAMALNLRVMVPIWGEYISNTSNTYGNVWKEYFAYQLLDRSPLWQSIPMKKLRTWAVSSLPIEKVQRAAVLEGIGMEDFHEWLVGILVVRRVATGGLQNPDPKASIASSIWNYVYNLNTSGIDATFMDHIRDKPLDSGPEGEKNSRLENYKIRQDVPEGDVAIFTYDAQRLVPIAQRLAPDMDLSLLEEALHTTKSLVHEQLEDAQLLLLQWTLDDAIPAKAFPYLNRDDFIGCVAVAQAVLWHMNCKECAALVSAGVEPQDGRITRVPRITNNRLKQANIDLLDTLYPYRHRTNSKQKDAKTVNVMQASIEFLTKKIDQHSWRLTLPLAKIKEISPNNPTRQYQVPGDIKNILAELAIKIASRNVPDPDQDYMDLVHQLAPGFSF